MYDIWMAQVFWDPLKIAEEHEYVKVGKSEIQI